MTESSRPGAGPAPAINLETELTCSICTDILYHPLTLLDCLHTFCGACLKEWFRFQAARAESAPGPPPPPDAAIFTCPSCRDRVRDTKHDPRVATLLDMFLALNPNKGKSEAEKAEMNSRYTKGESVMPSLKFMDRTEEQRRLDEQERRLLEEVQRMSLREATEAAMARANGGSGGGGRRRRSREGSRVRGPGTRERESSRPRTQSIPVRGADALTVDGESRRRSESRQRGSTGQQSAPEGTSRHVEHQSSLRNLISSSGSTDTRDIEREIEEFARQIQEEGLLDGLDLDNLDLENNDELSRKITEAYRRRHRERLRQDGGRRSNASAHSRRSEVSARPRSRTGEASRPTSRQTVHSRAPSSSSNEERGRYPPSSSALLEVQEPSRRRRTSSASRSATVPVGPTQPEVRLGTRSHTVVSPRTATADSQIGRPSIDAEARSSSSPIIFTASGNRQDPPNFRGLPFSNRAASALGSAHFQRPAELHSDPIGGRRRQDGFTELGSGQASPDLASSLGPGSPKPALPSLSSSRRTRLPRFLEPMINCATCSKERIEYELHFNCSICHNGEWNICLDCWRRRKGCLHWFGFGQTAWDKWEKQNLGGQPTPPPHMLTANRYLPPKTALEGGDGLRMLTTENPLDRLRSGTFCSRCSAWTNDCYWRCDVCNDGEWGFCNGCVNRGTCCSHPLLALAYRPPPQRSLFPDDHPPLTDPPVSSPSSSSARRSPSQTTSFSSKMSPVESFHPLTFSPCCEICRSLIPRHDAHHHCYACPSRLVADAQPGEYNLCFGCYNALVSNGAIAPENGPDGWRRCPQGHRMVVVGYAPDSSSDKLRRKVIREQVGGQRLKFETREGLPRGVQACSWLEGGREVERLVAVDVAVSAATLAQSAEQYTDGFPPDGGTGMRVTAAWGWIPAAGVEDELMFPKGAEISEAEDVNEEWFYGFYMGSQGLFPAPYVRVIMGG